ncbi:MAG: hypothetical protein AAGD43_12945 [Pseudomonadota bacterium]
MDFIDKQVAPPKSWEKFEDLTRSLFASLWRSPLTQKSGRSGQKQHGVDVYGSPADAPGRVHGVQCKGKNGAYNAKATISEFDEELAKAEKFKPRLAHWTFATTAPNDAKLQEHARLVSDRRIKEGRFAVVAIGWETIQALLSSEPSVAKEFYPEHANNLDKIASSLRSLPSSEQFEEIHQALLALAPGTSLLKHDQAVWSQVNFERARDLGSALMGRPLGPADVGACPVLPETALLLTDLERAGSARLAGVAGAGKSICMLQTAIRLHRRGWRVLRLSDPMHEVSALDRLKEPTLYIVDDAHLARPSCLRHLEEQATTTSWVLSAHTISDGITYSPGMIQLDAKRAVRVIADGLRADPKKTLAAVRRVDDRVGDSTLDDPLDRRIDDAEAVADFPWQFCFILGGGWRRASALADSARLAGADLVLVAAAIRQLATRDARCSPTQLLKLLDGAVADVEAKSDIQWLVAQRLLLSHTDLRCAHQRLCRVLIENILQGQDPNRRQMVAHMLRSVLKDQETPLAGIASLLSGLSLAGEFGQWRKLVEAVYLELALKRCWAANAPLEIRDACWALQEMDRYLPDMNSEIAAHRKILAKWIETSPEGACYAISWILNGMHNRNEELGYSIIADVEPGILATTISTTTPLHTCEIAHLISATSAWHTESWKEAYLGQVNKPSLLRLVSSWSQDAYLSPVATLCRHFCYFEPEFGFALIEALIPAIAQRLRDAPQQAFQELKDIFWHSLRLYDPLGVYVGKLAPTRRMKQIGRQLCACWSPAELSAKLSRSRKRDFQAAAGLLSFMRKVSPKKFEAIALSLDWERIDETIGADWKHSIGDARMLLGVASAAPAAHLAVKALIAAKEPDIVTLSTYLAALAPETARRHVASGKVVSITHSLHVDWDLGALVLARLAKTDTKLVPLLLKPHFGRLASSLSQPSPTFYNDALLFLRLLSQVAPGGLQLLLDQIDVENAKLGWRNALGRRENNQRYGGKSQARQVAALLVHHAQRRTDEVGELAQQLRNDFPKSSLPLAKTAEPIDLSEKVD